MVEVLVGDEQPVDVLRGERERRRRDESMLVIADPGVDDEPGTADFEPEARLTQPVQSDGTTAYSLAEPCGCCRYSAATISVSSSTEVSSVRLSSMMRPLRRRFTRSHISRTCT